MQSKNNITFLYTSLPSYMFRCIEELAKNSSYTITVVETSINKNYPVKFQSNHFNIYKFDSITSDQLNDIFSKSSIVFVSGWANNIIMKMVNLLQEKSIKLCLLNDQPKINNLKQFLGKYKLKNYLSKFEYSLVPGKKAEDLLIYCGLEASKIKRGLYTCDNIAFSRLKENRGKIIEWPKSFLFDGQLIKRKGISFLINEYSNYLKKSKTPWKLIIIGKGELEHLFPEYIDRRGFVNPHDVPEIYASAGCFVLTSIEDHWPLVVHQAVSARLPIVLSKYCYNAEEFLIENHNGYLIDPHKPGSLVNAMLKIERLDEKKLREMGEISYKLSKEYSVEKWVASFRTIIESV